MKKATFTHNLRTIGYNIFVAMVLLIPGGRLASQEISTIAEIYDYEVGDIFHYYKTAQNFGSGSGMWSVTNISIAGKYYSANSDTLYYVRDVDYEVVYAPDPQPEFANYTDTVFYTNLDSQLNSGNVDSVFSDEERYNGRTINYVDVSDSNSIWIWQYANGCGRVSDYFYSEEYETTSHQYLVYYKKGDEEWGSELVVSVEDPGSSGQEFSLYPNPAVNTVDVVTGLSVDGEAIVYSLSGGKLQTFHLSPYRTTLDISMLETGMYIMSIRTNGKVSYQKLMKE